MASNTKRRTGGIIYCRNDEHGTMDFFLALGPENFFLFRTRYFSKEIFREYQSGKPFDAVLGYAPKKRRSGLTAKRFEMQKMKLKERIARTVKYIDREYNLSFAASTNREAA